MGNDDEVVFDGTYKHFAVEKHTNNFKKVGDLENEKLTDTNRICRPMMGVAAIDDDVIVDDNVLKINDSIIENASVIPTQTLKRDPNVPFLSDEDKLQLSSWGLPEAILKQYASRGITQMFPWQVECLSSGKVLSGGNLVYSAPTSAGKTLVAEILTIKTVLEKKKKAIIILPFVSVVREKMVYFQELLSSSGIRVEGLMGGRSLPGGFKSVHIAICTIEKANSLINRLLEEGSLKDLGVVVVDELHLLGDPFRGYLLELLLTKIRYMSLTDHNVNIQIVGMSATLPNLPLLADWLDADLYKTDFRPVPLEEFYKCGSSVYNREHRLLYDIKPQVTIKDDSEHVVHLCLETIFNGHSALVFCSTKVWCENLAQHLSTSLRSMVKHPRLGPTLRAQLQPEGLREVATQLNNLPVGLDRVLLGVVCTGVAFHHAGLTIDERDIIESGFRAGRLRVLVATSTLSSGVNLPARRVIIRTPMFHGQPLDPQMYHQMIGRAGRMGRDTQGESFLVCKPHERSTAQKLVGAPLKPVQSCLGQGTLAGSLKRAILEVVASGVACSPDQVAQYTGCTLFAAGDSSMQDPVASCIDFLQQHELLRLDISDNKETRYIATPLGQACLAASLAPDQGLELFQELQKARQCFVLENELHIIYQVTPFSVAQQLGNLDWMQVLSIWQGLSAAERRVGELVGAEERLIVRAVRGTINPRDSKQASSICIIRRFYTALALQDLVQEVPLAQVAQKFSCSRGMLQALQQAAATFAGMVSAFCRRLGWNSLELLVDQFQSRLEFGVQRELCDLMRLDLLNGQRARALFDGGFACVADVAAALPGNVETALRTGLPFQSSKEREGESAYDAARRNELRSVWVTGRQGLTEKEAALLLVKEARELIQKELGCAVTSWDIENSSHSENSATISSLSFDSSSPSPKMKENPVPSEENTIHESHSTSYLESESAEFIPSQPPYKCITREQAVICTKPGNSCGFTQIDSSDRSICDGEQGSAIFGHETKLGCRALLEAKVVRLVNVNTAGSEVWQRGGPAEIKTKEQTSVRSLQLKPSGDGGVKPSIETNELQLNIDVNECLINRLNPKVLTNINLPIINNESSFNYMESNGNICDPKKAANTKRECSLINPKHSNSSNEYVVSCESTLKMNGNSEVVNNPCNEDPCKTPKTQNYFITSGTNSLLNQPTIDVNICEELKFANNSAIYDSYTPHITISQDNDSPTSNRATQLQLAINVTKNLDTPENGSNMSRHSIDLFSSPLEVANFTQLLDNIQNINSLIDVNPVQVQTQQNNGEISNRKCTGDENGFIANKCVTVQDLSIILDSSQDNASLVSLTCHSGKSDFALQSNLALKPVEHTSKGVFVNSSTLSDTDIFNSSEFNVALHETTIQSFLNDSQNKSQNLFDDSLVVDTQLGLALDHIAVAGDYKCQGGILASSTNCIPNKYLCLKAEAAVVNKHSTIHVAEKRNMSSKAVEDWLAKKAHVDDCATPPKILHTIDSGIDLSSCVDSKSGILSPHSPNDVISDTPPLPSTSLKQISQRRNDKTSKSTAALVKRSAPARVKGSKHPISPGRSSERGEDLIANTPSTTSQTKRKRFNKSKFLDGLMDEVPRVNKKLGNKRKHVSPNSGTKNTAIKNTLHTVQDSPCKKSKLISNNILKTQRAPIDCIPCFKENKENSQKNSESNLGLDEDIFQEHLASKDTIIARNILEPKPTFHSVFNQQKVPEKYTRQADCDNHNLQPKQGDSECTSQGHKIMEVDNIITSSFLDLNFDTMCDFDSKSQDTNKSVSNHIVPVQKNYAISTAKAEVDIAVLRGRDCVAKTNLSEEPRTNPHTTSSQMMDKNYNTSSELAADSLATIQKRRSPRLMVKNAVINDDQGSLKTAYADAENEDIVINSQDETRSLGNSTKSGKRPTKSPHSRRGRTQAVRERKEVKDCQLGISKDSSSKESKIPRCSDTIQDSALMLALRVTHVCNKRDVAALAIRLRDNKLPIALALACKTKPATSSPSGAIGAKIIGLSAAREPSRDLGLEGGGYVLEGVALCLEDGEVFYLSLQPAGDLPVRTSILTQLMVDQQPLVIWHAKEAIQRLAHCCSLTVTAPIRDPDMAAWLLQPEALDVSLKALVGQYCTNVKGLQDTLALLVGNKPAWVKACASAAATWHLSYQLNLLLGERQLLKVYTDVEMPVVSVLARLEMAGFGLDTAEANKTLTLLKQELTVLEKRAYQLAGHSFKLSSHTQLHKVLYRELRLPGGKGNRVTTSTSKEALSRLKKEHELPGVVQEWRKISATVNKCVLPFLKLCENGRVYGSCVSLTSTGRISMHEPNLQCVPRDFCTGTGATVSVRRMFVAGRGCVLVSADYCQLELRLLAHLARCPDLTAALRGPDAFTSMAAHWGKVPYDQVSDTLRQQAKQVCYGIIYGMGPQALSQQLNVEEDCATELMQDFMTTYLAVKTFLDETVRECRVNGFVTTLAGRRRYLPDITSTNIHDRGHAERQAVNSRVQGSAADIVKRAMVSLDKDARMAQARLVLNLHDELMYEVLADQASSVAQAIKEGMEGAVDLSVPLPVKVKRGMSWGSLTQVAL